MFPQSSSSLQQSKGVNNFNLKMPDYACMVWKIPNTPNYFKIPQEILAQENLIYNFITGSLNIRVPLNTQFIRSPILIAIQDVDGFYNSSGQINEFIGILEYDSEYTVFGQTGTFLSYKQNGEIQFKLRKKRDQYQFKLYKVDPNGINEIVLAATDVLVFTIRADSELLDD